MYSRPWAWFWTAVIGIAGGITGYLVAAEVGAEPGWCIVAGLASLALCAGACVVFMEPGKRSPVDRPESSRNTDLRE